MVEFAVYAFADYSGAFSLAEQRKRIVFASKENSFAESAMKILHCTRDELLCEIKQLLLASTAKGQRVICGVDHNYSFPIGFYEAITGAEWTCWEQLLLLMNGKTDFLPTAQQGAREWAEKANRLLQQRLQISTGGPFWGPHFIERTNPKFPFSQTLLHERRLVEERCRTMKPIYKIGGAGAVGLQSLYGIASLAELRVFCKRKEIPLFCWPYDGWRWPKQGHVLVEVYPTLYNQRQRTDEEDARSCVEWVADQDQNGTLREWLEVELSEEERWRARLDGWVLGIR